MHGEEYVIRTCAMRAPRWMMDVASFLAMLAITPMIVAEAQGSVPSPSCPELVRDEQLPRLPEARGTAALARPASLWITTDEICSAGVHVMLEGGRVPARDLRNGANGFLIDRLLDAIPASETLVVRVSRTALPTTVARVIYTAGQRGVREFVFVVRTGAGIRQTSLYLASFPVDAAVEFELTLTPTLRRYGAWLHTSDGRRIVLPCNGVTDRERTPSIEASGIDGYASSLRRCLERGGQAFDWAPDGNALLTFSDSPGGLSLLLASASALRHAGFRVLAAAALPAPAGDGTTQ